MAGEMHCGRKDFIWRSAGGAALALACGFKATAFAGAGEEVPPPCLDRTKVPPRNRRPYTGIDWSSALQINGTTHMHQERVLREAVRERRIGFLTVSNYYPSKPMYPWREAVNEHARAVADWPVVVNGKCAEGPFDWNEIISKWASELSEKDRGLLPLPTKKLRPTFKDGDFPDDMLEAPNAEHCKFLLADGRSVGSLHMCAPGSAYVSGTPGLHNRWNLTAHGYCPGSGEFWGTAIDRMIEKLVVPDGGGVTINHPTWSNLDRRLILEILDWDPRVLGVEALESGGYNSEHWWDWILSTGRQCFGFFVPDHNVRSPDFGVCVLVVPERTQAACLRAYRNGDFYGAAHGLGELAFTEISFDGKTLKASTDKPARFEVRTARGVVHEEKGTTLAWNVPQADGRRIGPHVEVFARVKAYAADGCGETLFSQPFMLV